MVKKINLAPTSPTSFLLSEKIDVDPGHRLLALAKYVPDLLGHPPPPVWVIPFSAPV